MVGLLRIVSRSFRFIYIYIYIFTRSVLHCNCGRCVVFGIFFVGLMCSAFCVLNLIYHNTVGSLGMGVSCLGVPLCTT